MKQMVLTAHNGVNLRYPLDSLAEFVQIHAAGTPADRPDLHERFEYIFAPGQAEGGFMVLGLDEEDELIGVLAMEGAATTQTGQHRLLCIAVHPEYQGQGLGRDLMRSAKMLSREHILLELAPTDPLAAFFLKMGFKPSETTLHLKR